MIPSDNIIPDNRVTVNSPKFVAVPANPSIPVVAASNPSIPVVAPSIPVAPVNVPLPQFTGFVRIGKSADIDDEEDIADVSSENQETSEEKLLVD